ncbi:uncharacterized protein LOC125575500 [Brassica napus]|uniref:uncharacterized protein LOC125575500 n=1 Tax=Brassica napus TaxID=3708 RepID=UPI002078BF47|nr:uncharacterized protein LOC125575500 [Brassica napus]
MHRFALGKKEGDKGFGNRFVRLGFAGTVYGVPMTDVGVLASQGKAPVSPGVEMVFSVGLGGNKGSWVGAVLGQKILKKYDVEVTMKDGVGSVIVPDEITKDVAPLWDDFLVGKFLDTAPHIAKVHAIVNKIWALNDKEKMIDVFEVNPTSMKFRILNQADRNRVLRRGMWNLAGIPVVMTKWSPVAEKEKAPAQSIPMWVHLKIVPLSMFSWQGLSFVASPVGSPVRLHPETAQCLNLDVAKIFVKADLTKELPAKMNFNIQGQDILVEYSYPRLPSKCLKCGKWGHKTCPITREEQIDLPEVQIGNLDEKNKIMEKEIVVEQIEVSSEQTTEVLVVSEESLRETGKAIEMPEAAEVAQENSIQEKEHEWLDVSPGKSCRSPTTTNRVGESVQDSILTNSRFSVLSSEEEEEREEEEEGEITEPVKDFELQTDDSLKSPVGAVGKVKEGVIQRQSLPRDSKMKHKFLGDTSVQKAQEVGPSELNKKKSCRHQ